MEPVLTPEQQQLMVNNNYLSPDTVAKMNQPMEPAPIEPAQAQPMEPVVNQPVEPMEPAKPGMFLDPKNFGPNAPIAPMTAPELPIGSPVELASDVVPPEEIPSSQRIFDEATRGIDMQQESIAQQAEIGSAKALEESSKEKTLLEENEKMMKAQQEKDLARQDDINKKFMDLDDQLLKANEMSVDPDRYWNNKGTGTKILALISMAIGAMGGDNSKSLNMMMQAINNDIDAQKADIQNRRSGITQSRGILSDMKSHYSDMSQAENATRLAYINGAQAKIDNIMRKYESPELQAKAQGLIGQLEQQKIAIKSEMGAKFANAQPVSPSIDPSMLTEEQQKKFVPGYGVVTAATGPEEIKQFKQQLSTASAAKENLGILLDISNKPMSSVSLEQRAEAQTIANMLKGQLRLEIVGPGAVTDREQEMLDDIIANPTKIFSLDTTNKARLKTLSNIIDRNIAHRAKVLGLKTPDQQMNYEPAK